MKEPFDLILMSLCFLGIGSIAIFAFVKVTLPTLSKEVAKPVCNAVRNRRVSILIPIICVCGLILFGGGKNNSQTNAPMPQAQSIFMTDSHSETADIIERQLVTADEQPISLQAKQPLKTIAHDQSTPQLANGLALIEPWWRRGGRECEHILTFDEDWCLPYGTNHFNRIEVWGSGAIYADEKATSPIVELNQKLSLKPHTTRVYCGRTTNDTYRIEWHDGYSSESSNETSDAAIELLRNGNILLTENDLTTEIPYEIPFEHDGFGQGETWVRANFENADDILLLGYTNWVAHTIADNAPNGLFCLNVTFNQDPPEIIRLAVGDTVVAVNSAGIYSFVLPKGERHEIELSFVPDGIDFSYYDAFSGDAATPRLARALSRTTADQNIHTEVTATGSSEDIEIELPVSSHPYGHVSWCPFLSIAPEHETDPTYPIIFYAYVDLPIGEHPNVRWSSDDGYISETGELLYYDDSASHREISVVATYRGIELHGHISIRQIVDETRIILSSPPVIVVEDPYTNRPNEYVARTSNTVKMTASWELAQAGQLRLESTGQMPTRVYVGDEEHEIASLPYDIGSFNAHENGSLDFYLTSTNMNATGNVGSYCLRFIPDEGTTLESSANVRIVKIKVEAEASWPSNKVRHVFGPKEQYTISIVSPAGGCFTTDAGESTGPNTVQAVIDGIPLSFDIQVIAPTDIRGEFIRPMTDSDWLSTGRDPLYTNVCGAGFVAAWYLQPEYVSFKNLFVSEGFAPMSVKSGCFLDTALYPPNVYCHDDDAGANKSMSVGDENRMGGYQGIDRIGVQFGNPPTSPGSYTLSIPWKWGTDSLNCIHLIRNIDQVISTDGEGNTTIRKLNLQHTRNAFE